MRIVPHLRHANRRGSATVTVLFLVVTVGGLSLGLLQESMAGRTTVERHSSSERALEIAEAGLVRAEMEILAQVDSAADGIGNVTWSYAGGNVVVTAAIDPSGPDLWTVTSKATHRLSTRRIVEGVYRTPPGPFSRAAFGKDGITMSASPTDAYDSRLGPYALQAINADARGPYALTGGHIGSNMGITLSGSTLVRGDAIPGPGYVTSGGATHYTGSATPLTQPVDLPYTPISEFQAAMASPSNGTWTGVNITYTASKRSITVSGGGSLILSAGTYFFTDITLSGGSVLQINGPVKIYTTGKLTLSGGTLFNATGQPSNCLIYSHPYTTLVPAYTPTNTSVTVSGGGTGAAFVIYGPESPLTFSGGGNVYGSYIAKTITNSGGSYLHYDKALGALDWGMGSLTHTYWREPSPPRR